MLRQAAVGFVTQPIASTSHLETPSRTRLSAVGSDDRDLNKAEDAVRDLLAALGVDTTTEDVTDTPRRVVAAYRELLSPEPFNFTTFPNSDGYDELVLVRAIPFVSLCAHHLLPFVGHAHVGYIPGDRIVGLSKLARVVHHFSRSLQVQERLTKQVADLLQDELDPRGVGVVIEAEHQCMTIRGVQAPGTKTATSICMGYFATTSRPARSSLRCVGRSPE